MRTFIADIIPKLQRFSQKLDDLTKLTNQHWVSLGDINQTKRVFIFRANNQLLISDNGIVEKGSWEYIGNQSLLMDTKDGSYLLKHGFFDENVIALKLDSTDKYAFFVNETKYDKELNNIDDILKFLENKYLKNNSTTEGLGTNKKSRVYQEISFEIVDELHSFDFVWGRVIIYTVKYMNGFCDYIYQGKSSGKFFYSNSMTKRTLCSSFEDAVHKLFNSIHK